MAYEILGTDGHVIAVRIAAWMRPSDQKALQEVAAARMAQGRKIRLLVRLENFLGWERGAGWDDVGFLMEHGDDIEKMAIVGEDRWKEDVFLFVGKGLRATEIEFFAPESLREAEDWVRR